MALYREGELWVGRGKRGNSAAMELARYASCGQIGGKSGSNDHKGTEMRPPWATNLRASSGAGTEVFLFS